MLSDVNKTSHNGDPPGTVISRPWGYSDVLFVAPEFKLKRLVVEPGHRLSLQRHRHRREHWYVISGIADVEVDGTSLTLCAGQSIDVPASAWHRLGNSRADMLVLVEVQCGSYFGEDDIERMVDDYGRADPARQGP
jgi:mannose-6-phosphate isomerase